MGNGAYQVRRPALLAGAGGRKQGIFHCLQDITGGLHRCIPHSGAFGAVRLGQIPGEGAFRGASEKLGADLPERDDFPG